MWICWMASLLGNGVWVKEFGSMSRKELSHAIMSTMSWSLRRVFWYRIGFSPVLA